MRDVHGKSQWMSRGVEVIRPWIFLQVLYGSKLKYIYLNYSFIRTHGLVERIAGSVTLLASCCCCTAKRNARSDNGSQNR